MMASLGNFKTHGGKFGGDRVTHNFGTFNFWGTLDFWESAKTGVFYLLSIISLSTHVCAFQQISASVTRPWFVIEVPLGKQTNVSGDLPLIKPLEECFSSALFVFPTEDCG